MEREEIEQGAGLRDGDGALQRGGDRYRRSSAHGGGGSGSDIGSGSEFWHVRPGFSPACRLNAHCVVETVVMKSTGVYWIPILAGIAGRTRLRRSLRSMLARNFKHLPGRKTDVSDAQWLQRLHSCGLLHAVYGPQKLMRNFAHISASASAFLISQPARSSICKRP